jgi:hypothetical protein
LDITKAILVKRMDIMKAGLPERIEQAENGYTCPDLNVWMF